MKFEPGHLPVYFVQLDVFERLTGYTRAEVLRKIKRLEWPEWDMWRGDPQEPIIDLRTYHDWVIGVPLPAPMGRMPRRRKAQPGAHDRRRARALKRQTPAWADLRAIDDIYAKARRRTLETGIRHQVDHVIPLLGRRVSGLHVETNLQILTAADNAAKSNRHG